MRLAAISLPLRSWIQLSHSPDMSLKLLVAFSLLSVAGAYPGKLLRVPKIYNALITTKEKLLPSEAYPATTGPIFQPIAFTGEPILLNANDFINSANQQQIWRRANENGEGREEGSAAGSDAPPSGKGPSPLVFYPRYGVYYPHHTVVSYVNTLQHSFVYTAVDHSKGPVKTQLPRTDRERRVNNGDGAEYPSPQARYPKNNGPINVGIPDVPPPPPPRGYADTEEENDKGVR